MADRQVKRTGKDSDGDITKLCKSAEHWSPRKKADAIDDIESGIHSYYVNEDGNRAEVKVVTRSGKKHLQTTPDSSSENNLDNLPDC